MNADFGGCALQALPVLAGVSEQPRPINGHPRAGRPDTLGREKLKSKDFVGANQLEPMEPDLRNLF
jgi:hypothetical protein